MTTKREQFSNIQKDDVRAYVDSLHAKSTPWADGCAAVLVALWAEVEDARRADLLRDDRFTGAFIENFVNEYDVGHEGNIQLLLDFGVALVQDLTGEPFEKFCEAALDGDGEST